MVGPTGRVRGLDVSGEMLAAAAAAAAKCDGDMGPIEWVEADAVTWVPDGPPHDVVISRFGVMFFSDAPAAFTNLARATRVGGRLAFAAWQRRDDSATFSVPFRAASSSWSRHPFDRGGRGPRRRRRRRRHGPFSLHDRAATARLLEGAGWADVSVEQHLLELPFAGGTSPADAAVAALDYGPTRLVLSGMDDDVLDAAKRAISDAFADHVDNEGRIVLSAAINLVTASRP